MLHWCMHVCSWLCLVHVCVTGNLHSSLFVPATWSPQALICVYIRCIVSKYIIIGHLLIINLDKKFWLGLIYRRIIYFVFEVRRE